MQTAVKKTKKIDKPFSKLSKTEQRVAIAKDALKWLRSPNIKAKTGTYVEIIKGLEKLQIGDQLDEKLPEIKCAVCAKGALFIAHVDMFDNCMIKGEPKSLWSGARKPYRFEFSDEETISERLSKHFSQLQLDMIEAAFEKKIVEDHTGNLKSDKFDHNYDNIPTEVGKACIKFGRKYRSDKNRLEAILKNIIKNKGEFKP